MSGAAGGPAEYEGMEQEHKGQHQGSKVPCRPEPRGG